MGVILSFPFVFSARICTLEIGPEDGWRLSSALPGVRLNRFGCFSFEGSTTCFQVELQGPKACRSFNKYLDLPLKNTTFRNFLGNMGHMSSKKMSISPGCAGGVFRGKSTHANLYPGLREQKLWEDSRRASRTGALSPSGDQPRKFLGVSWRKAFSVPWFGANLVIGEKKCSADCRLLWLLHIHLPICVESPGAGCQAHDLL